MLAGVEVGNFLVTPTDSDSNSDSAALVICVTLSNQLGAQRVKSAQGTIKILIKSDFSSGLTPLLVSIGGLSLFGGGGAQPKIGLRHSQRDVQLRPWLLYLVLSCLARNHRCLFFLAAQL